MPQWERCSAQATFLGKELETGACMRGVFWRCCWSDSLVLGKERKEGIWMKPSFLPRALLTVHLGHSVISLPCNDLLNTYYVPGSGNTLGSYGGQEYRAAVLKEPPYVTCTFCGPSPSKLQRGEG